MNKTFSIKKAINFGWNEFWSKPWFWILSYCIVFGVTMSMSNMFNSWEDSKKDTMNYQNTYTNSVSSTLEASGTVEGNMPSQDIAIYDDIDPDWTPPMDAIPYNMNIEEKINNNASYIPVIIGAIFMAPFMIALGLLAYVVKQILTMGYIKLNLDAVRGKKLDYKTLLSDVSVKKAFRLLGAYALYGVMVMFGLILFIIPGIYLAIKYSLVTYFIIDKDINIKEAFKMSAEATKGTKLRILGLFITTGLLTFAGLLCFLVGVIPASIIAGLALTYTYEELSKTVK